MDRSDRRYSTCIELVKNLSAMLSACYFLRSITAGTSRGETTTSYAEGAER